MPVITSTQLDAILARSDELRKAMGLQDGAQETNANPQTETVALVTSSLESAIGDALHKACARFHLPLSIYAAQHDYVKRWRACKNVITWGVKWRSDYYRRGGRNVLYLENGLLCQRSGVYIDHRGYFADSSIATEPQPLPTASEVAHMQAHVRRHLGYDWWHGGDQHGPILLAGQLPRDCSVRYHYAGAATNGETLPSLAARYLPAYVPVVYRQHPRAGTSAIPEDMPEWWTLDDGRPIRERITTCRAVVTITSTVATEAAAAGVPVYCLGRGAWVGSGAVVECADDPARLAGIETPEPPDEWATIRYLCSVMRHQLPYSASADQIAAHFSFRKWAETATKAAQKRPTMEQRAKDAAAKIELRGNDTQRELLAAINARYGHCAKCQHTRLWQSIIDLAERIE